MAGEIKHLVTLQDYHITMNNNIKDVNKLNNKQIGILLLESSDLLYFDELQNECNYLCEVINEYYLNESVIGNITNAVKKLIDKLIELIQNLVIKLKTRNNVFIVYEDMEVHSACFNISVPQIIEDLKAGKKPDLDQKTEKLKREDKIEKLKLNKTLHQLKRGLLDIKSMDKNDYTNDVITYFNALINDINKMIKTSMTEDKDAKDRFNKWLKSHNYKGDEDSGTITIDGETYNINISKSGSMKVTDGDGNIITMPRQTCADLISGTITIDKAFRDLKDDKHRDALLRHEIGHIKYQKVSENKSEEDVEARLNSAVKNYKAKNPYISESMIRESLKTQYPEMYTVDKNSGDTEEKKIHRKNLEKYKKYEGKNNPNPHALNTEYEADAYAAEQSTAKVLKKALNKYYRQLNKNDKLTIHDFIEYINNTDDIPVSEKENVLKLIKNPAYKTINKINNLLLQIDDMSRRKRALKDKEVDRSIYKNNKKD